MGRGLTPRALFLGHSLPFLEFWELTGQVVRADDELRVCLVLAFRHEKAVIAARRAIRMTTTDRRPRFMNGTQRYTGEFLDREAGMRSRTSHLFDDVGRARVWSIQAW